MDLTLHDVLEHDISHFAERTAVTIDDDAISYLALGRAVEEARHVLAPLVRPGDRVALGLPNSFAWMASFLALASLRAVSVPVNTRLTPMELRVILEDSGASAIIACPHYRGRDYVAEAREAAADLVPFVVSATTGLDPGWRVIPTGAVFEPSAPIEGRNVFCIQYTSGTTSTPKGVMLTEALYLRTAAYVARAQLLSPSTSFMSAAPFFHCSGSMHAITVCLLAGCTLHSVSSWDPEYFLSLIQHHRGQTGHGVFFRDIVAAGGTKARDQLATLKVAHDIGGPAFVRRLHDEFGIAGISNLYGMTETGGNFTMWFPDDPLESRIVMSGRTQPGNRIRIVDPASGTELPPGQQGEIQMRGPTVTQGYFRRPADNEEAFSVDGWFRSGDLGALTDQNELHFIARLRDIIRVGGENVSPVEVEIAVQAVTGLKELSILGVPDKRLGEVVALVVLDTAHLDWPTVLARLSPRLAGFKMPRHVYGAEAMPMTATNKVQRATLQQGIRAGRLRRLF